MKTKHTPIWSFAEMDNDKVEPTIRIFKAHEVIINGEKISDKICVGRIDSRKDAEAITLACNHHEELVEALEFLAPRIGSMLGRLRYSNKEDSEMLPKIQSLLTKLKG